MIQKIILVRHGTSEANENNEACKTRPDYALRLTRKGVEDAERAGEKIAKEHPEDLTVYCSEYFRARQTAETIFGVLAEKDPDRLILPQLFPELREQEWGSGEIQPYNHEAEKLRVKVGSYFYRYPGGESGADVENRLDSLVNVILNERSQTETLMIVTHGYTMRILIKMLVSMSVEEFEMMKNPNNGQVVVMNRDENGYFELAEGAGIPFRKKRHIQFAYNLEDIA